LLVASEGFFCGNVFLIFFDLARDLGCGTHLAFVAGEMDADSARDGVENVLFPGEPTPDLEPKRAGRIGKVLERLGDSSDAVFLLDARPRNAAQ